MPNDSGRVTLIITSHPAQMLRNMAGADGVFDPGRFTGAVSQPVREDGPSRSGPFNYPYCHCKRSEAISPFPQEIASGLRPSQ